MNEDHLKHLILKASENADPSIFETYKIGHQLRQFCQNQSILENTKFALLHWKNPLFKDFNHFFKNLSANHSGDDLIDFGQVIPEKIPLIELTEYLINRDIIPILISSDTEALVHLSSVFEKSKTPINLTNVDAEIRDRGGFHIMKEKGILNSISHLAHQSYLTNTNSYDYFSDNLYELMRLGVLQNDIDATEPIIRANNVFQLNLSAIKDSDAPNSIYCNPNGLRAVEACKLVRFAAANKNSKLLILNGMDANHTESRRTAHLLAQMTWFMLDGFQLRQKTDFNDQKNTKKYLVEIHEFNQPLVFIKDKLNGIWWLQCPKDISKSIKFIPCSYREYLKSCEGDLPDRLWNALRRIS